MAYRRFLMWTAVAMCFVAGCLGSSDEEVKRLEAERSKAAETNRGLQKQLADAEEAAHKAEDETRKWRLELDELHAKDDILKREHDDLQAKLAWTEERLTTLRTNLEDYDARLKAVTQDQAAKLLAESNDTLRKDIQKLETRLRAVAAERDRLRRFCKANGLDPDRKPGPTPTPAPK